VEEHDDRSAGQDWKFDLSQGLFWPRILVTDR
jgi:hypothetical protein